MRLVSLLALALLLLAPLTTTAQMRRRSAAPNTTGGVSPGALAGVTIDIHGLLKSLSKKELVVETPERETITLRRTSKTTFMRQGKEVLAADAQIDQQVDVAVAEDPDAKLRALVVTLGIEGKPKKLQER